jgi:phosphatidylglycerol---prolipoprotein diacylglyceryl transferase
MKQIPPQYFEENISFTVKIDMTYPFTINIGDAHIHLHVFFEIIAYTIGFQYYLRLRKQSVDLISEGNRLWIFIGAAFGGFLGSHILGIFEKPIPPQLA